MVIYLGADHRGFELKEILKRYLRDAGYEVVDMGNLHKDDADDYSDFGRRVAEKISRDPLMSRGILICGSGAGMDILANKFRQVRSVLGFSPDQVFDARHDDDVNVLSLAADHLTEEAAKKIVDVFLKTPFGGEERYRRRLDKIADLENVV
ncbi:MAG: RpiB/LacA/LacB family sugar-phosphate isomerase [candidate division KSB1 bacterium]|nr:RpiB/LacA/LacB family sugar-phosphate isomerase [candidate division KSB1 bacterium]